MAATADAPSGAPPQPPLEGLHPVLCTPEEERLFSTLLAAVRHSGAFSWSVLVLLPVSC